METEGYKSKYNTHVIRLVILLVVVGVGGFIARAAFTPDTMGQYGPYRGSDIEDQKNRPMRNMTNDSCFQCHDLIRKAHKKGVHKDVSCEVCHGAYANHIKDGKYVGKLPVKRGDDITPLCLRCHNKIIQARPQESIKVVAMPQHLEEKKVRLDHNCDQCHYVHDPLLWVKQAKEMLGIKEEK